MRDIFIEKFEKDIQNRSRAKRVLIALDQLINVLLWNGSQDETVSSHIARRIDSGKANYIDVFVCKALRLIENKHCKKSIGE